MYPGKGTVVLIRPAQTFYERIKDEKPWVLFDYVCTDEDGNTVVHHKHLSSLSEAISSSGKLATDTPDPTQRPVTEAYPYSPPVLEVKDPLQWIRDQDVPISTVTYASKNMPLGASPSIV